MFCVRREVFAGEGSRLMLPRPIAPASGTSQPIISIAFYDPRREPEWFLAVNHSKLIQYELVWYLYDFV